MEGACPQRAARAPGIGAPLSAAALAALLSAAALAALLAAAAPGAAAQPVSVEVGAEASEAPASGGAEFGRRVRSVTVRGAWARQVALPIQRCDVLTPQTLSAAFNALRAAAGTDSSGRQAGAGGIAIVYVDHLADIGPGEGEEDPCGPGVATVALTLRPLKVALSLQSVGGNSLPLPRAPLPALGDLLPALRPLALQATLSHDRAFGSALSVGGGLALAAGGGSSSAFSAGLVQSLDAPFYRADATLAWRTTLGGPLWREGRLRATARQSREPLAGSQLRSESGDIGGGVTLQLAPLARLALDGGWQRGRQFSGMQAPPGSGLRRFGGRALADALLPSGDGPPAFTRAALWADDGSSDAGSAYRRWVARAGWARELRLSPGQTLGVDVLAGAGRMGGTPGATERFYGGNSASQFLYDAAAAPQMLQSPAGPLLRSAGERQAALAGNTGGRSFWHLNLNLAWPVRAWSRPLIPDEGIGVPGPGGADLTLKQALRKQVDVSGPSLLTQALVAQGRPRADAEREAGRVFGEIGPAVRYIIDDAPLYAVRPLFLLDVAGLAGPPSGAAPGAAPGAARWVAAGVGLGITVVSARAEAGVMRTVSGPVPAGGQQALFLRLVFQNLF